MKRKLFCQKMSCSLILIDLGKMYSRLTRKLWALHACAYSNHHFEMNKFIQSILPMKTLDFVLSIRRYSSSSKRRKCIRPSRARMSPLHTPCWVVQSGEDACPGFPGLHSFPWWEKELGHIHEWQVPAKMTAIAISRSALSVRAGESPGLAKIAKYPRHVFRFPFQTKRVKKHFGREEECRFADDVTGWFFL